MRFPIVQANGERIPFRDGSFDLVFCDHGVMGFADPLLTVPEVARVLRPGGRFVFNGTTPWIWVAWGDEGDAPASREMRRDYFDMGSVDVDDPSWRTTEFQLTYGGLDPPVPRERPGGRGPDRAPAARGRDHDVRRLRADRVGAGVPRRAHLEGAEGVSPVPPGRRMAGAALARARSGSGSPSCGPPPTARPDGRPNVIVVLTDDQAAGTLRRRCRGSSAELARAGSGWTAFPNAFANTPLCCPARASLLTGLFSRHTGVAGQRRRRRLRRILDARRPGCTMPATGRGSSAST